MPKRIQNQFGQNLPKMRKYFKTPTIKVYDPMITWYKCGQSIFLSCHHVYCTEKSKNGQQHSQDELHQKDQNQGGQNPQNWENILRLQQVKAYDPMITWYRCGQSTFSSWNHMAAQRKAKMDKSITGRKPQRIRIKVDKTPKNEKIF